MCAGPLEQHKEFHDPLWAYTYLQLLYADIHLLVIGDGPDRRRLERLSLPVPVGGIHFLGFQPDAAALLAHAEVVWVPNRAEGGGNVALEGMAAGRPVVATRWPGLAEIVDEGQTGHLVAPGDRIALTQQTRLLLDDPNLQRQFGERGRGRVANRFSVSDLCRRFVELYESVLDRPQRSGKPSAAALVSRKGRVPGFAQPVPRQEGAP
jgi:glycosyltransferase involved in cell wall biosynthesis